MKRLIIALFIVAFLCSCGKKSDTTSSVSSGKVKYIINNLEFYDNGIATDKVNSLEFKYKEFDSHLQFANSQELNFFDFMGRIEEGWKMINYFEVKSKYQITNFTITDKPRSGEDTQEITQTYLIVIPPTVKHFEDEDTEEADAYFTVMDDWSWYISETQTQIEKMGVPCIWADKRYYSFKLSSSQSITVDISQNQNDSPGSGLLYKKGELPIIVYTIWIDNDARHITEYLGIKPKTEESTNTYVGTYHQNPECCNLTLDLTEVSGNLYYDFKFEGDWFSGLVTYTDDDNFFFDNVVWKRNFGKLPPDVDPATLDDDANIVTKGLLVFKNKDGSLSFNNIGDADHNFQVVQCSNKYVTLVK